MKSAGGHFVLIRLCILATVVQFGGCTVGSKSFSMDSISRTPFFGLELWERKPRRSGPAFREIRNSRQVFSRIETATGNADAPKIVEPAFAQRKGTNFIATAHSEISEPQTDGSEPPSLIFPVNDRRARGSEKSTPNAAIDFN